jgi:hypothetical protein
MQHYRIYRLSSDDRIIEALDFEAEQDAEAEAEAIRLDHAAVVEIWCDTRLVARVDPATGKSPEHTDSLSALHGPPAIDFSR